MANYKAKESIIRKLSNIDKATLLSIYQHRCLSVSQIQKYLYKDEAAEYSLQFMVDNGLLEEMQYSADSKAFFLTTLGIKTANVLFGDKLRKPDSQGQLTGKTLMASDLKMYPKNINHQLHLNEFSLKFASYAEGLVPFSYYDEKFMPPASDFLMPDGMIELPQCFLFLEMDMGTERASRLAQKWDSYRTFLNSPGKFYHSKPIVMFFILEGAKNIELKKRNVIANFSKYILDRVNGQFEVYVGGADECHTLIQSRYLTATPAPDEKVVSVRKDIQKQGFVLGRPSFFSQIDAPYGYYARKVDEQKRILVEDGRPQEFLLDVWLDGRVSLARNLMYFTRSERQIESLTKRRLPYVIVVPSEKWIYDLMIALNCIQPQNVYFTTPERLVKKLWPTALFCIDQLGNLMHYTDMSLKTLIHERRMSKKKI